MATPAALSNPLEIAPAKIAAADLRSDLDLTLAELRQLLSLTRDVKRNPKRYRKALEGKYLSLLFEKPSLRTRLTFELAIKQLGGDAVTSSGPIGDREPIKDVARNLDRWTDGIVARTFLQQTVDDLAEWAAVPVINALSDRYHPCQALADVFTLIEKYGDVDGLKLAYVGDGNNVAHSLLLTASRLRMHVAVATPPGYEPAADIVEQAREFAANPAHIVVTTDPEVALRDAAAVYTDVWASMGQEAEAEQRRERFAPYRVDAELMRKAPAGALFLHCLPAKRGLEVTDEMIESSNSVVFDQAENRLHAQKALLLMLLAE